MEEHVWRGRGLALLAFCFFSGAIADVGNAFSLASRLSLLETALHGGELVGMA